MYQIYHKWIVHEHKCLFSFVFSLSSTREREKGYIKLGIRRNSPKVYLSYFDGFLWRIFLLLRALLPGVLGLSSVRHEPCPTTNFLFLFSLTGRRCHFRFRVPANHLASLFFPPLTRRSVRATICHPVSHSFSIRSPSTNICFSILTWICYFGIDPHSFMS